MFLMRNRVKTKLGKYNKSLQRIDNETNAIEIWLRTTEIMLLKFELL